MQAEENNKPLRLARHGGCCWRHWAEAAVGEVLQAQQGQLVPHRLPASKGEEHSTVLHTAWWLLLLVLLG
jgi:hypothetical protein